MTIGLPMINGMRIVESAMAPAAAKLEPSWDIPLSEEFRRQFAEWAIDRFGLKGGTMHMVQIDGVLIVPLGGISVIRNQIAAAKSGITAAEIGREK